jgi:prepilin-type N-terminal cleavage/methylation domain-containing protein
MKTQPSRGSDLTLMETVSGFTLIEIMIVVGIIGLLAVIALPNYVKARSTSQKSACINNLRQIDSAKHQWAMETSALETATPTLTEITPYIGRGSGGVGDVTKLVCPADSAQTFVTSYTMGNARTTPVCIIAPTQHILP